MPLFGWALILLVASSLLQSLTIKKSETKQTSLDDFDFPQVDEGTPQAVFFGDCWTDGWIVLWYGNFRSTKIKKSVK